MRLQAVNVQEKLQTIKLSDHGLSYVDVSSMLGTPRSPVRKFLMSKAIVLQEIKNVMPVHTIDFWKDSVFLFIYL